jgi:hypothetical protein
MKDARGIGNHRAAPANEQETCRGWQGKQKSGDNPSREESGRGYSACPGLWGGITYPSESAMVKSGMVGISRSESNTSEMSSHTTHSAAKKKKFHQDWRIIVAAVVMMIAMIMYVLTMDETVVLDPMKPAAPAASPANP